MCKKLGITKNTCYRWRKEYGGLKVDQAKRMQVTRPTARRRARRSATEPMGEQMCTAETSLSESERTLTAMMAAALPSRARPTSSTVSWSTSSCAKSSLGPSSHLRADNSRPTAALASAGRAKLSPTAAAGIFLCPTPAVLSRSESSCVKKAARPSEPSGLTSTIPTRSCPVGVAPYFSINPGSPVVSSANLETTAMPTGSHTSAWARAMPASLMITRPLDAEASSSRMRPA
ncbi:MAG: hypothetical protein H6806_06050 [Planctomycetes bacterium]|nr:hypothetical protein [Planctomycetota bacterium]MCB9824804.1 hypothetical protein [Planctomycetota bacterium]MCB9829304.1 hypothetical protein [Planctomycetota bacterium]MCB9902444.1 hypothetical protein [Planctomycetota bacterium]